MTDRNAWAHDRLDRLKSGFKYVDGYAEKEVNSESATENAKEISRDKLNDLQNVHKKITSRTIRTNVEGTINIDEVRTLFNLPPDAKIFITVPSGGDYCGDELEIDKTMELNPGDLVRVISKFYGHSLLPSCKQSTFFKKNTTFMIIKHHKSTKHPGCDEFTVLFEKGLRMFTLSRTILKTYITTV